MGGPSGGSGGKGGSVYLRCVKGLNTLGLLRRHVHHRAFNGKNGEGKSKRGSGGKDVIVDVPQGTVVKDVDGKYAGELIRHGDVICVAKGGHGGRGNLAFKTQHNNAPKMSEKGELGAERWLNIELRLVADVGFVGVPNAGKSTLLAASSNAKPKIANYPFTTVVPNLGVCDVVDEDGLVLADIPG